MRLVRAADARSRAAAIVAQEVTVCDMMSSIANLNLEAPQAQMRPLGAKERGAAHCLARPVERSRDEAAGVRDNNRSSTNLGDDITSLRRMCATMAESRREPSPSAGRQPLDGRRFSGSRFARIQFRHLSIGFACSSIRYDFTFPFRSLRLGLKCEITLSDRRLNTFQRREQMVC